MLALVLVPLVLACVFGGLRIHAGVTSATELRSAAQRAVVVPAVAGFMADLETAMVTMTEGRDAGQAMAAFEAARSELQHLLDVTPVDDNVRLAVNTLLDYGQGLLHKIGAGAIDLRTRVMTYGPLLITAQTAITGLVGTDDAQLRADADTLSRAVGARGQMAMQRMLVSRGAELPEPLLRSAMVTVAGTEPATVTALGGYLGGATEEASALRSEMVKRMSLLSDPATVLVGNPELRASQEITEDIADDVIAQTAAGIPAAVARQADDARATAIRDAALVGAAILLAATLVALVARSMVRPLQRLRDSALKVAHEDLAREVDQVRRDGWEFTVEPIPVHTSEEVGQVAHAVDELHQQAVVLAGEQARLQMQVSDMFETLSRRNRSLVDRQLALIDGLERDEQDPARLESLFHLDHLAARMRRNGANLMVLAGARVSRDRSEPVPVTALVNAAASEVEDYPRVVTGGLPDTRIDGAVAGDLVHVLAELIDNGLRYSPPSTRVRVSAVPTGNNGLVIEVSDIGLGMTDSGLRVANTRLESGGEVTAYTARHMGLFVAGRLAAAHGLVVRLRSTVAEEPGSGTTAGVYLPARLLVSAAPVVRRAAPARVPVAPPAPVVVAAEPAPAPTPVAAPVGDDSGDAIYQTMLSEWLVDPHELSRSTDLDWKSVWDNGWSAAEAAAAAPVLDHTPEGLPMRRPGARLVPGHADRGPVASAPRDPEAVRASIGSHFGGVNAGRRRAQETGGSDSR